MMSMEGKFVFPGYNFCLAFCIMVNMMYVVFSTEKKNPDLKNQSISLF